MSKKLTRFERLIEVALLDPAGRFATKTMVELQALTMIAVFANFFRITVEESPGVETFPSILTVIEAPSGAGKNSVTRFMEKFILKRCFDSMRDHWHESVKRMKLQWDQESEDEANEKFPGETKKDEEKRIKYIEKREKQFWAKKRAIDVFTSTHGSYEGFAFDRAYLQKFKFGAPYVRVEEYGNLIIEMKQAGYLRKMYDALVELVDNPKLISKSIKDKQGSTPGSTGMGITCLFTLSNPTEKQKEYINSIILQAAGRRGFLVAETIESLDHDRAEEMKVYDLEDLEDLEDEVHNCFQVVHDRLDSEWDKRCIPLTKDAREQYFEIKKEVGKMYTQHAKAGFKSDKKMQIATILKDLDRKTLKIAVLLAVFNHGEERFEVTKADLELAYEYSMRFFEASKDYFNDQNPTSTEKILAYIVESRDISARQMWDAGLFPRVNQRSIQDEIALIIENEIQPYAEQQGYEILRYKKRKADWYSYRKLSPEELEEIQIDGMFADRLENSTLRSNPELLEKVIGGRNARKKAEAEKKADQ